MLMRVQRRGLRKSDYNEKSRGYRVMLSKDEMFGGTARTHLFSIHSSYWLSLKTQHTILYIFFTRLYCTAYIHLPKLEHIYLLFIHLIGFHWKLIIQSYKYPYKVLLHLYIYPIHLIGFHWKLSIQSYKYLL
jgi:hypothetical protein